MIVIPATDLRDGHCVQLVGGQYDQEKIRRADVPAVVATFAQQGFSWLHLVDLDAAMGKGSNQQVIATVLREKTVQVQVGGGVRTTERIASLLESGASRVVVGTRAVEDPSWLREVAAQFPNRLVVAADVRGAQVVTRGWTSSAPLTVDELVQNLSEVPVWGFLVTQVQVEGTMRGPDLPLFGRIVPLTRKPIIASGGVGSIEHLRSLAATGVHATVVGMAAYTGALDMISVAQEFGE